jgi:methionyl-tRNA formyltransferase
MNPIFAYFGTSLFSIIVLDELKNKGFIPKLIVTVSDKPKGRKLKLTPPETKVWAENEKVPYIQLKTLKGEESEKLIRSFSPDGFDLFIVASYGKLIPKNILEIPKHKTLNVHPSLLPKLRGPSPIESAILRENETGVSIMVLDEEMDHGPLISQKKVEMEWPPYADKLEETLAKLGGEMLREVIPGWISGEIEEKEQNHDMATLCQKIQKTDGEINFSDSPDTNLRKIRAYNVWPGAYFFYGPEKMRVIVKKARVENGELVLEKVLPEGRKEMDYRDFLNREKSR